MAGQRTGWPGIWKVFCCLAPKDPPQPQPQSDDIPDSSHINPENDSAQENAQASLPQRMHQTTNTPCQDIDEMYLRRIYDLEQELHTTMENNRELSRQLNEMGRLVFPELADCTQLSLIERLKIYLECQLIEKQDLERRVIEAEAAMLEMEKAVAVLQRRLQNADYSSSKQMDTPENDVLELSTSTLKVQDFDTVSTTSTLPVTTPLSKSSDDNYETPYHSSDNPDVCFRSPTLEESVAEDLSVFSHVAALPIREERLETQEEMLVRSQENVNSTLDMATKKPMDWPDPITCKKFESQANLLDPDACEAKPIAKGEIQVTHGAGKDASGDDLLDGGKSLSTCLVHASETKMEVLTPEISQAMSIPKNPEEALFLIHI